MSSSARQRVLTLLLVCLAAPLLIWPALGNRYPLLFPDTIGYLAQGREVLHALAHATDFHGMRSAMYALLLYPFHRNRSPWPILLLNAAAVVYPVFLMVRTFHPRHALRRSLLVLIVLSVCTALPWYIALLMPDILGAPLYLALFLLTFARAQLTRTEQLLLALIAIAGATAHSTHLLISLLLLALFAFAKISPRPLRFSSAPSALKLFSSTATIAAAILLQLALNARLLHHLTLDGNRPPYLEARLLADGPAKSYLLQHCPDPHLPYLCAHIDHLPPNDDDFLWGEGLYATATPAAQQELLREERPLAAATLRAFPFQQLRITFTNIAQQLLHFGLDDFDNNDYMQQHLNDVLPNARARYDRSLQAHDAVPWVFPTVVQNIAVILSLLIVVAFFRRATPQLRALTATVFLVILANAALAGALSEVDSRYQARIIWLVPFVAMLCLPQCFVGAGLQPRRSISHLDSGFSR